MKALIKYLFGALLFLFACSAANADADGIRLEVEQFFNSSVGNVVLFILLFLLLLWLLLPLAVFGLKSKLNTLIQHNQVLTRDNRETNKLLSDIRDELAGLSNQEIIKTYSEPAGTDSEGYISETSLLANLNLARDYQETNKILADIRDILAALSTEETEQDYADQSGNTGFEEIKAVEYDEIKFDP